MRIRIDDETEFVPSHLVVGMVFGAVSLATGGYALWELKQVTKEEISALFGAHSDTGVAKILPRFFLAE